MRRTTTRATERRKLATSYELEGSGTGVSLDDYCHRRFTASEVEEARSFFNQLKPPSKTYITAREFHKNLFKLYPTASRETRHYLHQFLDKNYDDRIDFAEWLAGFAYTKEVMAGVADLDHANQLAEVGANMDPEQIETLRMVIDAMDTNKNGTLSRSELEK
jgi:Ca2+-binding EF-hand superfamily protein